MKNEPSKESESKISSHDETQIGRDVSNSVVVSGNGNVINLSDKKTPTKPRSKTRKTKQVAPAKPKPNVAILVAIIGLVGTICAALIASPILSIVFSWILKIEILPIEPLMFMESPTEKATLESSDLATEFLDSKDVQMMLIPAGNYAFGDVSSGSSKTLYLDSFYINKYEVTNAQYALCVRDGMCPPPLQRNSNHQEHYFDSLRYAEFPVIYLDSFRAYSYCSWRGGYVPTTFQWEKAARGIDGRPYPWGNNPDCDYSDTSICVGSTSCDYANFLSCIGDTTGVAAYDLGKSSYNIYNMSGNVWEWVRSFDLDSEPFPDEIRGGIAMWSRFIRIIANPSPNRMWLINITTLEYAAPRM